MGHLLHDDEIRRHPATFPRQSRLGTQQPEVRCAWWWRWRCHGGRGRGGIEAHDCLPVGARCPVGGVVFVFYSLPITFAKS
jgi:hypothetical protein